MPKMAIPAPMMDLFTPVYAAWAPFIEEDKIPSDNEFKQFNVEAGKKDRAENPAQYIKNASRIMDYYIFNAIKSVNNILNQYENTAWNYLGAMNALNSYRKEILDPALNYLDETFLLPSLIGERSATSDRLYKKMQLYYWFLHHMDRFVMAQQEGALIDYSKIAINYTTIAMLKKFVHDDPRHRDPGEVIWGNISWALRKVIDGTPARRRLYRLETEIDAYATKYGLVKMSLQDIEKTYVYPPAAVIPEKPLDPEVKQEEMGTQLSAEEKILQEKLYGDIRGIHAQIAQLKVTRQQLKDEEKPYQDNIEALGKEVGDLRKNISANEELQRSLHDQITGLRKQFSYSSMLSIFSNQFLTPDDEELIKAIKKLEDDIQSKQDAITQLQQTIAQKLHTKQIHITLLINPQRKAQHQQIKASLAQAKTQRQNVVTQLHHLFEPKVKRRKAHPFIVKRMMAYNFKTKRNKARRLKINALIKTRIKIFQQKTQLKNEHKNHQQLERYKILYAKQLAARQWKTILAIVISVITALLLAIPAYLLWRRAKRNEVIQKMEMSPQHYKNVKQLRKALYSLQTTQGQKTRTADKPQKAVEKLRFDDPQKPAIYHYYMDNEQANRFRFFEERLGEKEPLPLTAEEAQTLKDSKQKSVMLMRPAGAANSKSP